MQHVRPEQPVKAPEQPAQTPGIASWFLATASTITVGAFLFAGHLAGTGVHKTSEFRKLSEEIDSAEDLSSVFLGDRYQHLVGTRGGVIAELAAVDAMVLSGQLARVQSSVSKVKQIGSAEATALATALSDARGVESKLSELDAQAAALDRLESQIRKDYFEAAYGLASLLGYKTSKQSSEDALSVEELVAEVYSEGLLATLPKVEGIPDSIEDVQKLLSFISQRRQKELQFEMAQKRTTILKEVAELQDAMLLTLQAATTRSSRKQEIVTARTKLTELEAAQRETLSDLTRSAVKALVRPKLSPKVQLVTDAACDIVTCAL